MRTTSIIAAALVLGVVAPVLDAGRAIAATVKVAANGVDSATCGKGVQPPCRTLAQAVSNAAVGDTVLVSPGSFDGTLIDKRLILLSTNGAAVTTVSGPVTIDAGGTVLGRMGKGFTFLETNVEVLADDVQITDNVVVRALPPIAPGFALFGNRTTMTANHLTRSNVGILVWAGTGHELVDNVFSDNNAGLSISAGTDMIVRGNTSTGNAVGFIISGNGHVVQGNVSMGDAIGFGGSGHNVKLLQNIALGTSERGFELTGGTGWILTGNVASANPTGFFLMGGGTYQLTGNVATGNSFGGLFLAQGSGHVVTGNYLVGNGTSGLQLDASVGPGVVAHKNNLFGNGSGCGITNNSGNTVDATNNFWGAATGPGANPADTACGAGAVTTAPFATKAFLIKLPALP